MREEQGMFLTCQHCKKRNDMDKDVMTHKIDCRTVKEMEARKMGGIRIERDEKEGIAKIFIK